MAQVHSVELNVSITRRRLDYAIEPLLDVDTVTLAPDLVIPNQSIGVASVSQGFSNGVDGILG